MLLVGSNCLGRILLAQVGYPLANGRDGVAHRANSDRVVTQSVTPVADEVDEQEGELVLRVANGIEARGLSELGTEVDPVLEMGVLASSGLGSDGSAGVFERSAEISREAVSGDRWSSRQGLGCG